MGVPSFNPFRDERAASILLMAHGGSLLRQSTADEVVTSMAKEMAHVIASHSAEQKSCTRLINLLLGATMIAAVMSGVNAWFGIPLVMLASYIGPIYWKALKKRYASHRFFTCKCLLFTDPR